MVPASSQPQARLSHFPSLGRGTARSLLLCLLIGATVLFSPPTLPYANASTSFTHDQVRLVVWGESRFAQVGPALPEVEYVFHADTRPCNWHRGLYHPDTGVLEICTMNREVLVHELAHAWADANLTAADQAALVARRGLPTWDSHEFAWELRGTEHVAEIIAWGLALESKLVSWIDYEHGGEHTFRLLTIPDSQPDQLIAEYRLLTGTEPIFRHSDERTVVENGTSSFSPEAARAQS